MRSYTLTSVWGIPIRINISLVIFLPLLVWLIISGQQIEQYTNIINTLYLATVDISVLRAGLTPWFIGITAAIGLFVSVVLHELGHSWVAQRYGLTIDSITLWIFGGVASIADFPREWTKEFWIALAGPVTSGLLALLFTVLLQLMPAGSSVLIFILGWLSLTNVSLVVFNLIPAFPMDGGRILRALLVRSRPYVEATRLATRIATLLALVMAILGVLSFNVFLILIALFVYGAARSESQTAVLSDLLEGITAADLMTRDVETVTADTPVTAFINRMLRERQTSYPVVDETGTIIGIVALRDVQVEQDWDRNTVRDIARDVPTVSATTTAFDVLTQFGRNDTEYVLVDTNDASLGLISYTDVARALEIIQRTRDADRRQLARV